MTFSIWGMRGVYQYNNIGKAKGRESEWIERTRGM